MKLKLNPKLLDYQKRAVLKAYSFILRSPTHSCYNASEIGTGKTVMAIELLNILRRKHKLTKTLIISPACVEYTWLEELQNWLSDPLSISVLDSGKKFTSDLLQADVCITSYGLIRGRGFELARLLGAQSFKNIIYDESHNLKNTRAQQTKAAFYLWECVKTRQALSGTPFLANIVDGYSLFHRMAPKYFPDFDSFVKRYSFKTITPWAIKYFGVKRPKELRRVIRKNFYFRYTLEDNAEELPPVQWIRVPLPAKYSVEKEIEIEIRKYEEELSKVLYNLDCNVAVPVTPALSTHRKLQGEKAFPAILEFCTNILEQQQPLVIFGHHKNTLKMYSEKLSKYSHGLITGDTPLKLRAMYVKEFQSGKKQLLILNYVAGGVGITITKGNIAVAVELTWNPTELAQAAGRLRRIGQRQVVNFYYFETIKSIDTRIISVVRSKAASMNKVM